ncbi:MAG: hypothetical protein LBL82_04865 [Oscillospiraceae bacterium]|jgi:signal transduction histidine kinase|nr:hypothetical protein [Oscillospiraceae bacterium]
MEMLSENARKDISWSEQKPNGDRVGLFDKPTHLIERSSDDINCVISAGDLQARIESFCVDVKHPVSLYAIYDRSGGNMQRINAKTASGSIHFCCESLRICAGKEYCEQCDIDHAELFKGEDGKPINIWDLEKEIKRNIEKYKNDTYKNSIYYNEAAPAPEFTPWGNGRHGGYISYYGNPGGYISYYCPILGYREMIFPVVVSDLVLGVIFRRQIQRNDDDPEKSKTIRKSFIDSKLDIFDAYFSHHKDKYDDDKKAKFIDDMYEGKDLYLAAAETQLTIDNKSLVVGHWVSERKEPYSKDKFDLFISDMQKALENLTKQLQNSMQTLRKNYVAGVVREISASFYRKVMLDNSKLTDGKKVHPSETNPNIYDKVGISPYWKRVEIELGKLVEKLDLRDIQVYGAAKPHSKFDNSRLLEMVAFYSKGNIDSDNQDFIRKSLFFQMKEDDIKFSYPLHSSIPLNDDKIHIDENLCERIVVKKTIRNYLGWELDETKSEIIATEHDDCMNLLYYLVHDSPLHSTAVVVSYEEKSDTLFRDDLYIIETILNELSYFSTQIAYISSYLLDNLLQTVTEQNLRIFNHELSNALLEFDGLRRLYINDPRTFLHLEPKERWDIIEDFKRIEETIRAVPKNIKILTTPNENIKPINKKPEEFERFQIFKDMFHKWNNLYKHKLSEKNICFKFPPISADDPNGSLSILKDKQIFEQIVSNIVYNAVKYSHHGTQIHMDCKLQYNDSIQRRTMNQQYLRQVLSIVDYGVAIESNQKPYQLYYRNSDAQNMVEGSGVGLFVVKRLADILEIQVRHNCLPISDYNVALIDEYIRRGDNAKLKDEIAKEKHRLGGKINEIVNPYSLLSDLSKTDLEEMIKLSTYKVIFEVLI